MQATAELGKLGKLPQVGDKVGFYQRNGVHNNIVFQRDTYSVSVEGSIHEFERLKKVAEAFDSNLLKAQNPARPTSTSLSGYGAWPLGCFFVPTREIRRVLTDPRPGHFFTSGSALAASNKA